MQERNSRAAGVKTESWWTNCFYCCDGLKKLALDHPSSSRLQGEMSSELRDSLFPAPETDYFWTQRRQDVVGGG